MIAVIFGLVLIYTAIAAIHPPKELADGTPPDPAARLRLAGSYPTPAGERVTSCTTCRQVSA